FNILPSNICEFLSNEPNLTDTLTVKHSNGFTICIHRCETSPRDRNLCCPVRMLEKLHNLAVFRNDHLRTEFRSIPLEIGTVTSATCGRMTRGHIVFL